MKGYIVDYMPYLLSLVSVVQIYLTGNLYRNTWLVGLGNQALWLVWILTSESYGFLPMNIALWVSFTRNHLKWKKMGK